MNIKIITMHAMDNPGSVFQAYALEKYLSKNNNVKIIDYRPDYFYYESSKWKFFLKKLLYRRAYCSRRSKFDSFISSNMHLTERFRTYSSLCDAKLEADIFIVGSDQLWNTDFACGKDEAYYLSFVRNCKKISYATSVGKSVISDQELEMYRGRLIDFHSLSVREQSTARYLSAQLGKKVSWVADPVFLLRADEYLQFVSKSRLIQEKYIVVYLAPSSELIDYIVSYFRDKGFKIVLASGFTKRCKCDVHIKDVGPEDFLNLIFYSELVVSTSFHATAFSHIFHKNFFTILPPKNAERIVSLVNLSGLSDRTIAEGDSLTNIDSIIDWDNVDKRLEGYISASKNYLEELWIESLEGVLQNRQERKIDGWMIK